MPRCVGSEETVHGAAAEEQPVVDIILQSIENWASLHCPLSYQSRACQDEHWRVVLPSDFDKSSRVKLETSAATKDTRILHTTSQLFYENPIRFEGSKTIQISDCNKDN